MLSQGPGKHIPRWTHRSIGFDNYQVDTRSGELRSYGLEIRLQPQRVPTACLVAE